MNADFQRDELLSIGRVAVYELLHSRIPSAWDTARVIVMTGYNQIYAETAAKLGKARGLASVTTLTKPILFDDLQAALENTRDTSPSSPQKSTP